MGSIFASAALQAFLVFFNPAVVPTDAEIAFWSIIKGVDPHLAIAVSTAESGNVPEANGVRDRVISLGNYGRFQVQCSSWREKFGVQDCNEFLDHSFNIRAGVAVLSYIMAHRHITRRDPVDWVAHYNEGTVISPGGLGERFAKRVQYHLRKNKVRSQRMFGRQAMY